jgi:conjugal transfer pilus assembly protein TrbC
MKGLMMFLIACFCVLNVAQSENHKTKEYEDFARQLKRRTDDYVQFSQGNITEDKTDIDAILNKSIPNWQSLNTNKKQQSQGVTNNDNQESGSIPLVFISFSMPEALIEDYIKEARMYGGVLVLRGLVNNSLKQTVAKLKEIEGNDEKKSNIAITIHPHLFKLYNITQVPTIVVSKDNLACILKYDDCSTLYEYDKISGSITIGYALEEFEKNGSSLGLRKIAKEMLSNRQSL